MSDSTQETRSINDLIKLIEGGKLVLPEFQRDFKWPEDKTCTLFDSINKNLFIGSLILSKPKFDLACKGFDLRPRGSKKHKPKPEEYQQGRFDRDDVYTLLDGQQRTTSIYRAIKGIDKVYYCFQDIDTLMSGDLYETEPRLKITAGIEEYIDFVDLKEPKDERLSVCLSDLYEHVDSAEEDFLIELIEPQLEALAWDSEQKKIAKRFAVKLFSDFKTDILKKEKLLSVQLLDMPLEKFCLFFERSNSQGMNLSFVDIVNAKVYIDFKLSEAISEAQANNQFFHEKLVDPLVRYINYLAVGEVTKDSILRNIKGTNFNDHWKTCVDDIEYIQKWLSDNRWVFKVKTMPYVTMLLPFLSFYQNLPNKEFSQASEKQMEQLKFWFFGSLLDNRYAGGGHGSTNVVIKKDCDLLKKLARGVDIDKDYWSRFKIDTDFETYKRMDNARSAAFTGLLFYIWHKSPFKSLENSTTVSLTNKVDVHHIFPIKYVKSQFGPSSDEFDFLDSVLNKILINKISNIKIGGKSPSEYLSEIKQTSNANVEKSLDSHAVPLGAELVSGQYDGKYLEFLEERFSALSKHLNEIKQAGVRLSKGKYENVWQNQ
ncbi:GmrSD restriction endonuclease domain-containing protein [Pseudidiomarina sp.]|uniref:GmrSD restriction endonuclease domain-containing protein n=1 Tax=Pseudidiomarina sp. TaxID=2081707 RepID=UPI003A97A817